MYNYGRRRNNFIEKKKKWIIALILIILLLLIFILYLLFGQAKSFTITFDTNGGTEITNIEVNNNEIVSTGYNGPARGEPHCKTCTKKDGHKDMDEYFSCPAIHAEQNCLSFAAKNGVSTDGCTLYITTAPCVNCAKIIIASGIKKVVYKEIYKNDFGIHLLNEAGISCEGINEV